MLRQLLPQIRVQRLDAVRAQGVGKIHLAPVREVVLHGVPVPAVIADLLARRADGEQAAQGLHFVKGLAQVGDEAGAVALGLHAGRDVLRGDDGALRKRGDGDGKEFPFVGKLGKVLDVAAPDARHHLPVHVYGVLVGVIAVHDVADARQAVPGRELCPVRFHHFSAFINNDGGGRVVVEQRKIEFLFFAQILKVPLEPLLPGAAFVKLAGQAVHFRAQFFGVISNIAHAGTFPSDDFTNGEYFIYKIVYHAWDREGIKN